MHRFHAVRITSLAPIYAAWTIATKVTTTKLKPILAALFAAEPAFVVVEMAPVPVAVAVASATLMPKEVVVMTEPETVVV